MLKHMLSDMILVTMMIELIGCLRAVYTLFIICEKIVFGRDEITEMASVGPFYKKTKIIQKLNYIFDSLGKKLFFTLSSSHTNRKGWKEKGAPTFIHSMVKCQPWTDPINEISVVKICNACLFKAFWVNEKCWTANQNA